MIIQILSGYNNNNELLIQKFSSPPDQDGKGGYVGNDAEHKDYPEYKAGR